MDTQKHILLGDPIYASPKHEIMCLMMAGVSVTLLDPEGEYQKLLTSLVSGGRKMNISAIKSLSEELQLNPKTDQEIDVKRPLLSLNAPTE